MVTLSSRAVASATTAALITLAHCVAPVAAAVTPPRPDDAYLPAPARPAPPQPTEQREFCTVGSVENQTASGSPSQLSSLELASVWRLTRGAGQTVAVIDTGVTRHRRLVNLVAGGDYVATGDGTQDCDGHGTVIAGIIAAAANPSGRSALVGGVAPDAAIIAIRQTSDKFRPRDSTNDDPNAGYGSVETLARAVRTAADSGATVINISSVACASTQVGIDDRALGAAIAYAVEVKDVVVVAAAGNVGGSGQCPEQNPAPAPGQSGWESVKVAVSPGWYDDYVLTVGSVDATGSPSAFTLAGPWVDVAAPGENVLSLDSDGDGLVNVFPTQSGSVPISGTSYAAPVVTGVVALARSRFPQLTARQVMQRIEETARHPASGWDPLVGNGTVDVLAAVSAETAEPGPTLDRGNRQPVRPPASASNADSTSRNTALAGAAICAAGLAIALAATASIGRLRRRRDTETVVGD